MKAPSDKVPIPFFRLERPHFDATRGAEEWQAELGGELNWKGERGTLAGSYKQNWVEHAACAFATANVIFW